MDSHEHRFFVFKTFETFEQLKANADVLDKLGIAALYQKVEYAVLGCNCGEVIKKKVNLT